MKPELPLSRPLPLLSSERLSAILDSEWVQASPLWKQQKQHRQDLLSLASSRDFLCSCSALTVGPAFTVALAATTAIPTSTSTSTTADIVNSTIAIILVTRVTGDFMIASFLRGEAAEPRSTSSIMLTTLRPSSSWDDSSGSSSSGGGSGRCLHHLSGPELEVLCGGSRGHIVRVGGSAALRPFLAVRTCCCQAIIATRTTILTTASSSSSSSSPALVTTTRRAQLD
eukprot:CAMPEP_0175018614 /NCGR_PEP_ID=MMETSP0005-20121125/13083_1 /TAXON_ID=420556 /ORGANISM="Ochromonas sp., Strain CCMP1393" /LENGTH=226 /DNA_ID=CAMNT_0016276223 /DNA_START=138 /DNA_END=815 /DNA_ORIENTATION=-